MSPYANIRLILLLTSICTSSSFHLNHSIPGFQYSDLKRIFAMLHLNCGFIIFVEHEEYKRNQRDFFPLQPILPLEYLLVEFAFVAQHGM